MMTNILFPWFRVADQMQCRCRVSSVETGNSWSEDIELILQVSLHQVNPIGELTVS